MERRPVINRKKLFKADTLIHGVVTFAGAFALFVVMDRNGQGKAVIAIGVIACVTLAVLVALLVAVHRRR